MAGRAPEDPARQECSRQENVLVGKRFRQKYSLLNSPSSLLSGRLVEGKAGGSAGGARLCAHQPPVPARPLPRVSFLMWGTGTVTPPRAPGRPRDPPSSLRWRLAARLLSRVKVQNVHESAHPPPGQTAFVGPEIPRKCPEGGPGKDDKVRVRKWGGGGANAEGSSYPGPLWSEKRGKV